MRTPFMPQHGLNLPLLPFENIAIDDGGGAFNLFGTCVFAPICLWSTVS